MAKVIFESTEHIRGRLTGGKEWVHYSGLLQVRDSGKKPVSLQLTFLPPHPLACDMPTEKLLRGDTITDVYEKLVRFLGRLGVQFRG